MKLRKYDKTTSNLREDVPAIHLARTGVISLTASLATMLGVSDGDGVAIHQDEETPSDWYITKDKEGFTLRKKHNSSHFLFSSKVLCNAIAKSIDEEEIAGRMLVAKEAVKHEGMKLHAILTSSINIMRRNRKK